jgi:hypothetical protein
MLQHIQGRGISAVFQGLPRLLIVFGVVLIAIIEFASRLPDLVLLPQKMQAALGEYDAKAMQPKVVTTGVEKTEAEARLADSQAQLNAIQEAKVAAETKVAQMQAEVTAAQVAKTQADTQLAQTQAVLAATQAQKTQAETQLAQAQTTSTNLDAAQKSVGLAMTGAIIGAGVKLFGGGSQTQDTSQAAVAQPPARAPVTGPALLTTARFIALADAGDAAVGRHDCTTAIQKYNEGEAIMRSIAIKRPEDVTPEQRTQGMRIASLRIFINNPQNCPGLSVK